MESWSQALVVRCVLYIMLDYMLALLSTHEFKPAFFIVSPYFLRRLCLLLFWVFGIILISFYPTYFRLFFHPCFVLLCFPLYIAKIFALFVPF